MMRETILFVASLLLLLDFGNGVLCIPLTAFSAGASAINGNPAPRVTPSFPEPFQPTLGARVVTDSDYYDTTPTAYNPYSYSIPDWYSYTDYSIPSYSIPSYSIPSYSIPSYSIPSYEIPTYTAPDYSYPTAGGGGSGGGGKTSDLIPEVATEMKKINWKKIAGAIAGSVTGFFGLVGGIWAGCKRRMRKAVKGSGDEKQILHGRLPSDVPSLGYQPNAFGTVNEPLLAGTYYPQHHTRFQSGQYIPSRY